MLKTLEKEERDHKFKKKKKYFRDTEDYQSGYIFAWQQKMPLGNEGTDSMDTSSQGASSSRVGTDPTPTQLRRVSYHSPRRDTPRNRNSKNHQPKPSNKGFVQPPNRWLGLDKWVQAPERVPLQRWEGNPVRQGQGPYSPFRGYDQAGPPLWWGWEEPAFRCSHTEPVLSSF